MLTSILSLVGSAAAIFAGILAYRNSANRQRRLAESDVAKKEASRRAMKNEIRTAVFSDDDAKINEIAARLLAPVLLGAILGAASLGCASKTTTVYVPSDRRIETCTNSFGVVCKAVPNVVFAELLEKAEELAELRREMAVDKRLAK